jgi:hypothetical protein
MPPRKTYNKKKRVYRKKKTTRAKRPTYKQVRQIAKNVILGEAESKYYSTASLASLSQDGAPGSPAGAGLSLGLPRTGYPQMQVIGFASGSAAQVGGGGILRYGLDPASGAPRAIYGLQHGRVFAAGDANGYAMEGSYTSPSLNITTFNLQRVIVDSLSETLAATSTPYFVRVVRVMPRPIKSSRSEMDPQVDLFLDQFSQEIGVSNGNFRQYELQMLKVNTKKYKLIQDFDFVMNPPITYNQLDIGGGTYQVSTVNSGSRKQMTFKHNIGKKLFYEAPRLNSNPSDGFHNEFILFHVIPLGSENAAGISPDDIKIAAKAVGTFKDV